MIILYLKTSKERILWSHKILRKYNEKEVLYKKKIKKLRNIYRKTQNTKKQKTILKLS